MPRKVLWCFISALGLALAFAPYKLWFLAYVALIPFFYISWQVKSKKAAFWWGTLMGVFLCTGTYYWCVGVMTRYGGLPFWLALLPAALLVGYMSLYFGAASLASHMLKKYWGGWVVLLVPCAWAALDFLRNYLFFGLPWNLLGYTQWSFPPAFQMAEFGGIYLISFFVVLVNVGLAWSLMQKKWKPFAITVLVLACWIGSGQHYISTGGHTFRGNCYQHVMKTLSLPIQQKPNNLGSLNVALIQGNIPQDEKIDRRFLLKALDKHITLTESTQKFSPDLFVWPESAVIASYEQSPWYQKKVISLLNEMQSYAAIGTIAFEANGAVLKNRLITLGPDNEFTECFEDRNIISRYDKMHLVPYGEYVPLQDYLPFVKPLVKEVGNYEPGSDMILSCLYSKDTQDTLCEIEINRECGGILFSPALCYEIIFPEHSREAARKGAEFMVTITNDAWFGKTSAPYQHLVNACFRAVETRKPVVRAANTGVSAFIDKYGRITQQSELFTEAVLTGTIETNREITFYVKHGDRFAWTCVLLTLWALLMGSIKMRWKEKP